MNALRLGCGFAILPAWLIDSERRFYTFSPQWPLWPFLRVSILSFRHTDEYACRFKVPKEAAAMLRMLASPPGTDRLILNSLNGRAAHNYGKIHAEPGSQTQPGFAIQLDGRRTSVGLKSEAGPSLNFQADRR
jgi:hypothetical protein